MDASIRQLQASVDAEASAKATATAAEGGGMELIYAAAAAAAAGGGRRGEGGGGEGGGGMEGSTLYVGNLPPPLCSMTPLHEHFKRFGEVVNMRAARQAHTRPPGSPPGSHRAPRPPCPSWAPALSSSGGAWRLWAAPLSLRGGRLR